MIRPLHILKNSSGMSLLEVTIAATLMLILGFGIMTMQSGMRKGNNYLEFQMKRSQLQGTIVGQFLNNPDNCKCLFQGAGQFPVSGIAALTGAAPTAIGRYNFSTPGVCAGATMPSPMINAAGIDGMKLTSMQIQDVMNISGAYSATLVLNLQSMKEVSGPANLPLRIPVSINTTPGTPGNVAFTGCATAGGGASSVFSSENVGTNGYVKYTNGLIMQWGQATSNANSVTTINFNTPFTTAAYSITVSGTNDNGSNSQDNWPTLYRHPSLTTLTTFKVFSANGGSDAISWFAVGK